MVPVPISIFLLPSLTAAATITIHISNHSVTKLVLAAHARTIYHVITVPFPPFSYKNETSEICE